MDVTLHFGAHRTATTTFQRMMGQNGAKLRQQGIAYWGPKRTRSQFFDGMLGPQMANLPWKRRRGDRAVGRVKDAVCDLEASGVAQLLVSEENMLGGLRHSLRKQRLYPDVAPRVSRLAQAFGAHCAQIGIGIRTYDSWWASAIAFSVARAGPVPCDALSDTLAAQPRRWRDVIADLSAAFPRAQIRVWTHEDMAARPEAVAMGLLGPELPHLSGARDWHNAAPTPAAMRGHLAASGETADGVHEDSGRFMPFDDAQRRKMQTHYAEDIAWLRSGTDTRITYIDDPGAYPFATGQGRGQSDEGRVVEDRRLG